MLDQIRRQIQDHLEELLGEIDKLRRALTALTSRDGEPDGADRAAPASSAAGESVAKSLRAATRRAPRTRKASVPPRSTAQPSHEQSTSRTPPDPGPPQRGHARPAAERCGDPCPLEESNLPQPVKSRLLYR